MRKKRLLLLLALLSIAAYFLAWVTSSTAPFTLNGYDLAEWTSLHPAVRAMSPMLFTTFALRACLACLMLALLVALKSKPFGIWLLVWALAGAALLPPFEFFSGQSGDPNYQQQLALALAVWVIGWIVLWGLHQRPDWTRWVSSALAGFVIIMAWLGYTQAHIHLSAFQLSLPLGSGIILLTILQGLTIVGLSYPEAA